MNEPASVPQTEDDIPQVTEVVYLVGLARTQTLLSCCPLVPPVFEVLYTVLLDCRGSLAELRGGGMMITFWFCIQSTKFDRGKKL